MEDKKENSSEDQDQKHNTDSGNDSTNEMLQKEKLIDPGNEHNHNGGREKIWDTDDPSKHDADAGGDATGTMGSKPE